MAERSGEKKAKAALSSRGKAADFPDPADVRWKRYKFENIPILTMTVISAPSNVGKTVLMENILKALQPKRTFTCCVSAECYAQWARILPFLYCFNKLDEVAIKVYDHLLTWFGNKKTELTNQKNMRMNLREEKERPAFRQKTKEDIEKIKVYGASKSWEQAQLDAEIKRYEKHREKHRVEEEQERMKQYKAYFEKLRKPFLWMAIFDDLSNQLGSWKLPILASDAMTGRHSGRWAFFLAQDLNHVQPGNRGQAGLLILWPQMAELRVKTLLSSWIKFFMTQAYMKRLLDYFTKRKWWMVINLRPGEAELENNIFYCTTLQDDYVENYVGCPEFIYYHRLMFDHQKAEAYLQWSVPQLAREAKISQMHSGSDLTKKQRKELEDKVEIDTVELQNLCLVRQIGPKREYEMLNDFDAKEEQWFAIYKDYLDKLKKSSSSSSSSSKRTPTTKKKKPTTTKRSSTARTKVAAAVTLLSSLKGSDDSEPTEEPPSPIFGSSSSSSSGTAKKKKRSK